jgi:hypothetical protein
MYREVDGEEVVLERDSNYEITYEDLLTYAEWYECPRQRLDTCKSMACQLWHLHAPPPIMDRLLGAAT